MSPDRLTNWFCILLLSAMAVCGIFDHDLWTPEEPRVAEIGREMLDTNHNWAVPMLNNEPFIEKPPLSYWAIALCLKIFGTYDCAARIPNMVFTFGILLFTYLVGKRLFHSAGAGLGSAMILMTSAVFLGLSHRISCDIGLTFFVAGAFYFLHRAFNGSAWWYVPFYIFACGAFFSKGFIAFVFLGLAFFTWVIWTGNWKEIIRARPWIGVLLLAIPIFLWFAELANYPRGDLVYTFVVKNHLHRFFPVGGRYYSMTRGEPFYYYLTPNGLPGMFAPWILFLIIAIPYIWSRRRENDIKFPVAWFAPGFLILSISGGKSGTYLPPILPPLAILTAGWFYAKKKERLLNIIGFSLGILIIAGWFTALFVFRLNEEKSMKPFCERLSSMITPSTELYGFIGDDEIVRGIVPFYTGRYLILLHDEKELASLSNKTGSEIAVITYESESGGINDIELVRKYFPYVWLKRSKKYGRNMWVLSNVKKGSH